MRVIGGLRASLIAGVRACVPQALGRCVGEAPVEDGPMLLQRTDTTLRLMAERSLLLFLSPPPLSLSLARSLARSHTHSQDAPASTHKRTYTLGSHTGVAFLSFGRVDERELGGSF